MGKAAYTYEALPAVPIAVGANAPDPGVMGATVWSTVANCMLCWDGAGWRSAGLLASGVLPAPLGVAAFEGVSPAGAAADHVHAHGTQTDPSLHASATTTRDGFMPSLDQQKLDTLGAGVVSSIGAPDAGNVPVLNSSGVIDATCIDASGMATASVAGRSVVDIAQQGTVYGLFSRELVQPRGWTSRTRKMQAQWGSAALGLSGLTSAVVGTLTAITPVDPYYNITDTICRVKLSSPAPRSSWGALYSPSCPVYLRQSVNGSGVFTSSVLAAFRISFNEINWDRMFFGLSSGVPGPNVFGAKYYENIGSAMFGFFKVRQENAFRFIQTDGVSAYTDTALTEALTYRRGEVYDLVMSIGRTDTPSAPVSIGIAWRRWPDGGWVSQAIPANVNSMVPGVGVLLMALVGNSNTGDMAYSVDVVHMFLEFEG